MSDLSSSIAAIQEFFVTQDRCRDARADEACEEFLLEVALLDQGSEVLDRSSIDLVQLAEIWPLLELRDAMLAAERSMANINGEATIILRKVGLVRAHSYGDAVTLVKLDALESATASAKRINARSARQRRLS